MGMKDYLHLTGGKMEAHRGKQLIQSELVCVRAKTQARFAGFKTCPNSPPLVWWLISAVVRCVTFGNLPPYF